MSERWRPGEMRFLGLPPRRAWVAALVIALVAGGAGLLLSRVFGVAWISAIVAAAVTVVLLWLGAAQWIPVAWWLAGESAADEEKRRRR